MRPILAALAALAAFPVSAQTSSNLAAVPAVPVGVVERAVTIGQGEWSVPAIITLPANARNVPAIALLHGFGPGTVDAKVGPNKIFQEMAWGLASRGVATIRHAKRTTEHASMFKARGTHATVAEEWTDDAAGAVALLRQQPEVNSKRIFVMGNSASAGMSPRIALDAGAAGAILVSGGASRFQTPGSMIVDQATYVASLNAGNATALQEAQKTAQDARRLDDPAESDDTVIMRHPLWYWRSLNGFDPVADIGALTKQGGRVLIVQGGRDYLVGPLQWNGWAKTLAGNRRVTRRLLPNLNHMMQAGTGKMRPDEYGERRPVDAQFLDLVGRWARQS